MKVLNLYAGIGGNRKLWQDVEVTAVEYNEEIAGIYKEYFPNDTVIIGDAHEYLLKHYKEFDFIWASPPCPSHSAIRKLGVSIGKVEPVYPDMKLWEEIIFLKHHHKGKFIVENVTPYYEPIIAPSVILDRHLLWSNFKIDPSRFSKDGSSVEFQSTIKRFGFNIQRHKIKSNKQQVLRNLVNPDLGLYILEQARGIMRQEKSNQLKMSF